MFLDDSLVTVGIKLGNKTILRKITKLSWDTSGQGKQRSVVRSFVENLCHLVFDLNHKEMIIVTLLKEIQKNSKNENLPCRE